MKRNLFVSIPVNFGSENRIMWLCHRESIIPGRSGWYLNRCLAPLLDFFIVFLEAHQTVAAVAENGDDRKSKA